MEKKEWFRQKYICQGLLKFIFKLFAEKRRVPKLILLMQDIGKRQFQTGFILHPPPSLKSISKQHFFPLFIWGAYTKTV